MIRFSTAGESHGEALIALVSGLPAGVPIDLEFVNRELWRRQQALLATLKKRPDLIKQARTAGLLTKDDEQFLREQH